MKKKTIDPTLAKILKKNGFDFTIRDTPKDFLEYTDRNGKIQKIDLRPSSKRH